MSAMSFSLSRPRSSVLIISQYLISMGSKAWWMSSMFSFCSSSFSLKKPPSPASLGRTLLTMRVSTFLLYRHRYVYARMVSLMTIFSGLRTSLTVVLLGSSSRILTRSMLSLMSPTLSRTSSDGRGMSMTLPTVALAMCRSFLIIPKPLSRYQFVTSGKLRSLRVSPVGAVSMTMTSYLPSSSNWLT